VWALSSFVGLVARGDGVGARRRGGHGGSKVVEKRRVWDSSGSPTMRPVAILNPSGGYTRGLRPSSVRPERPPSPALSLPVGLYAFEERGDATFCITLSLPVGLYAFEERGDATFCIASILLRQFNLPLSYLCWRSS
jgi:hypothetical protein